MTLVSLNSILSKLFTNLRISAIEDVIDSRGVVRVFIPLQLALTKGSIECMKQEFFKEGCDMSALSYKGRQSISFSVVVDI